MPKRIYRKNFLEKLPAGSKLVALPSKWGNPYTIPEDGDRPTVVKKYRLWIESQPEMIERARRELRGLDLACYCTLDELCHADILLEIANSGEVTAQVEPVKKKQERREAIARQAIQAGDLMTESGHDRMPIGRVRTYKFNAIDAPSCGGWWWCYPVPECEWYDRHRDGLVCHILHDNGISLGVGEYYYSDDPGLYVQEVFGTNSRGFTDLKYSDELVGKWYGPIESPIAEPQRKESDMKVYHRNKSKQAIPGGAVSIGRGSSFVNPFKIGRDAETAAEVIKMFTEWAQTQSRFLEIVREELRGHDLLCDCTEAICHGEALMDLANGKRYHKKRGQKRLV